MKTVITVTNNLVIISHLIFLFFRFSKSYTNLKFTTIYLFFKSHYIFRKLWSNESKSHKKVFLFKVVKFWKVLLQEDVEADVTSNFKKNL